MQSFDMALRSIGANKMRAALTMLGIIIGVMALVVLVSLVNGATNSVTTAVSDLGTSLVTVTVSDDKGKPIHLDDLNTWMSEEPDIGRISARTSTSLVGKHGANYDTVTVYGITPSYYDIQGLQLSMGRWLKTTDQDNRTYVCVLNDTAAKELIGYTDCVGQTVVLGGVSFAGGSGSMLGAMMGVIIIGVLNNGMQLIGMDSNMINCVKGIVLLIAIGIDSVQRTGKKVKKV